MMKRNFYSALLMVFLVACHQNKEQDQMEGNTQVEVRNLINEPVLSSPDNSQTALDWTGTYFNVLPCASCEGIETWLTLNPDQSFELKTNYLGLNDAREEIFTGKFTWNEGGSIIQLLGLIGDTPGKYKVGENQIWHLDQEGNKIEGQLADRYILHKK